MKMIRLLWQEDPKGLTRTAIVRFLWHEPRTFSWNLPGRQKNRLCRQHKHVGVLQAWRAAIHYSAAELIGSYLQ